MANTRKPTLITPTRRQFISAAGVGLAGLGLYGAGFRPAFAVASADPATAQGFVAAGVGVALIPRLALRSRRPDVVVRSVRSPEPIRRVHATVRESALAQSALRTLLDALAEAATSRRR